MVVAVEDSKWQIWGRKFESFIMFEMAHYPITRIKVIITKQIKPF